MQIVITGAYGQLGSEIKNRISEYPEWNFVFTDIDSLDITNETAVNDFFSKNKFDFVVNCAAYTAVDKAESDPENAEKVNALAPKILSEAARSIKAKIIHVSTDYVFSGDSSIPYSEEDKVQPLGVYGRTKRRGEVNVLRENSSAVIIRTAWLYSVYGNNFVKTMLRLGKERGELNVVFDQIGSPTNAADLSKAILEIISETEKNETSFVPGIYHFSNEGVASWYDFAVAIFELSGIKCKVNPVTSEYFPTPAKRPNFSVLNKSKIKDTFGVHIPYWKDSLMNCLEKLNR